MVLRLAPCYASISQPRWDWSPVSGNVASRQDKGKWNRGCTTRPRLLRSSNNDNALSRVFVVSDLHADYSGNMDWIKSLSTAKYIKDVLIVAGDNIVSKTVSLEGQEVSWENLDCLLDACRRLGVTINPAIINGLGIIPLYSWRHESFDREDEITSFRIPPLEMDESLTAFFNSMNESNNDTIQEIIGNASRQELCPEKRLSFYSNLPKIIGSECLEARIRSIHGLEGSPSACYVFCHTHFCWDQICASTIGIPKRAEEEVKRWTVEGAGCPSASTQLGYFQTGSIVTGRTITVSMLENPITLNWLPGLPDSTAED